MSSVHFIKGGDVVLVGDAVSNVVAELVGDGDRSLMVEELDESVYADEGKFEIRRLVDAAQTPPFLTERRVVVARHCGRFSTADDVAPLVAYLDSPLESTHLVLVWEKGESPKQDRLPNVPKSLTEALKASGALTITAAVPAGKGAQMWLDEQLGLSPMKLDAGAKKLLIDRLGEDRSRVGGVLKTLESTYGAGSKITAGEIEPFLGQSGSVPPWDLTDAIHTGDIAKALDKVQRMTAAGDRHALQIMASLHTEYGRLLRLDGAGVGDEKAAAQLLGMKGSTFPAKKAPHRMSQAWFGQDRTGHQTAR